MGDNIENVIRKRITECSPKKETTEIKDEMKLKEDLGLCSFDMMVLIRLLEQDGIIIENSGLSECKTVRDLINAVK